MEIVDVFDVRDGRFAFRNRSVDEIRRNDGVFRFEIRVPAVHFARAFVVEYVQRFAEDTHVADDGKKHAVFKMHFRRFPKREFKTVHALRCTGRLFEFDKVHLFKLFVERAERANSFFVNHALWRGDGSSFWVDIL